MYKSKGKQMVLLLVIFVLIIGPNGVSAAMKVDNQVAADNGVINHLVNGGFEQVVKEAEPEGWWTYSGQKEKPGITTESQYIKAGHKAAYIVPASSITFNLSGLKPNTAYTYSAFVKLSDEVGSAKLGAKLYDGSKPDVLVGVSGTDYKQYSVSFTTGDQTTAQIFLWSSNGLSGTQRAYLDEVVVKERDKVDSQNLVINPSFEIVVSDFRPAKWRVWSNTGEMPGTVSDSENVYEGNRAGFIIPKSSLNYDLTGLRENTTYKYSAYVKLSDESATAILGVVANGKEMKQYVKGTEFSKHEIIFNTGSKTTATVYFYSDGQALQGNQKGYIDQAMVEEYFEDGNVRVTLNMNELLLAKGDQYPLNTKVLPANAPNKDVKFASDNPNVISVDADGLIHAVAAGTATITASPEAGGSPAITTVTVTETKEPWYPDRANNEWILTKEDNFDGTELDTELWSIRGKEYATYHRDDMVSVSDGTLKLKIEREPDGNVVLGRVDTHGEDRSTNEAKFDQKYGFFEVRAKIPPTEKTYFAFWLFNYPGVHHVDGTGKDGLEIDVTETVWQGDYTETALHWDGYGEHHKSIGSGKRHAPNIHDGFHQYGLEWSEDYLKFYFDGKLTWTYTDKANIPWVKEVFILSSGWARSPGWGEGNIDNAQLPYFSEIDWFRAYQKKDLNVKPDTTKPILYGLNDLQIPLNSSVDLKEKVFAIDNRDDRDDITNNIHLDESNLKRDKKGDYLVTYTVRDAAGNETSSSRKVTVVEPDKNLVVNEGFDGLIAGDWEYDETKVNLEQNIDKGKFSVVEGIAKLQRRFAVKPFTKYELSFEAKIGKKNGAPVLVGVDHGSDQQVTEVSGAEWRTFKSSFLTGADDYEATFYLDNVGAEKSYLDSVKILEVQTELESPVVHEPNVSGNSVTLSWNGVENAFSYHIYQVKAGERKLVGQTAETNISIENLEEGTIEFLIVPVSEIGAEGGAFASVTVDLKASDVTAPVTTSNAEDAWIHEDFTLKLTPKDNQSGVDKTFYSVNGSEFMEGTIIEFTESGVYGISFYSVDKAGNEEEVQTVKVNIDRTAPIVSWDIESEVALGTQFEIDYTAKDDLSGITEETVTIDGRNVKKEEKISLSIPGEYTVNVTVTNNAGLVTTLEKSFVVFIPAEVHVNPKIIKNNNGVFTVQVSLPNKFESNFNVAQTTINNIPAIDKGKGSEQQAGKGMFKFNRSDFDWEKGEVALQFRSTVDGLLVIGNTVVSVK